MKSYLIFVVNDFLDELGGLNAKSDDIVKFLFKYEKWYFKANTMAIQRIVAGNEVIVYIAGPKKSFFFGTFRIASSPIPLVPIKTEVNDDVGAILSKFFTVQSDICDVNVFKTPVSISHIKNDLRFISNKNYYGIFMRQATRRIEKVDYDLICNIGNSSPNGE